MTMTDSGGITYVGDRARAPHRGRRHDDDGLVQRKQPGRPYRRRPARVHVPADRLAGVRGQAGSISATRCGRRTEYDLNVPKYRTARGASNPPLNPATYLAGNEGSTSNILVPAWPTVPRLPRWGRGTGGRRSSCGPPTRGGVTGSTATAAAPAHLDPTKPSAANPVQDVNGNWLCDWRRRFFLSGTNAPNPQTENVDWALLNANTMVFGSLSYSISTQVPGTGVNNTFVVTGTTTTAAYTTPAKAASTTPGYYTYPPNDQPPVYHAAVYHPATPAVYHPAVTTNTGYWTNPAQYTTATTTYTPNYAAILKWLKTGPQTLPPNLRAGRVLYYASIPDDVNTATGNAQQVLDKAFWKNYIDFVLGINQLHRRAEPVRARRTAWSSAPKSISTAAQHRVRRFTTWEERLRPTRTSGTPTAPAGPACTCGSGRSAMIHFLPSFPIPGGGRATYDWLPGTCYQAHSWQLKAGMNSVISDVRSNHPNDYAGLVYFSSNFVGVRSPLGQNYTALQNALFYPESLYSYVNAGNITQEVRPYTNTSLTGYNNYDIPNAGGQEPTRTTGWRTRSTCSPLTTVSAGVAAGTGNGRRGAQKLVILETDGVPNTYRNLTFNKMGYNSYYPSGTSVGTPNGDPSAIMNPAYAVIQQMVQPMATTAVTTGSGANSGVVPAERPARCRCSRWRSGTCSTRLPCLRRTPRSPRLAAQFLANCASYGGTEPRRRHDTAEYPDHHRHVHEPHHQPAELYAADLPERGVCGTGPVSRPVGPGPSGPDRPPRRGRSRSPASCSQRTGHGLWADEFAPKCGP